MQRLYPEENARKTGISLYPLSTEIVRDYEGMLWTLFGSAPAEAGEAKDFQLSIGKDTVRRTLTASAWILAFYTRSVLLAELRRENPGERVGRAARRIGHEQANRPRRVLRPD